MIQLKNISKTFHHAAHTILDDVSVNINSGETLVLLGASGSGKTTLLKMINGLCKPTSGDVIINSKNISAISPIKLRRSIGYVPQDTGLFPHMSVAENVSIVLRLQKESKAEQVQRSTELLELVGLRAEKYSHRYPHELSGGEQQRVGVARALANNPDVLLMDEPFAALDAITRLDLQNELLMLKQKIQKTIVFVTHDLSEALKLADRVAILNLGKIEQLDYAEAIIKQPKSDFVKHLFEAYHQQIKQYLDFAGDSN